MQRMTLALGLAALLLVLGCDQNSSGPGGGSSGGTPQAPASTFDPAPIPLLILDSSLPVAVTGQTYSHQMTAIGGSGTYYWTITGGAGTGLVNLTPAGVLTVLTIPMGTTGTNLVFTVQDSLGRTANRQLNLHANMPPPPPSYLQEGTTYVLHGGSQMAAIDQGQTLSRFQRAVQSLMAEIADRLWDPAITTNHDEFAVVLCGHDNASLLPGNIRTAQVADKISAINALATLTPGGDAPMYAAIQLAETTNGTLAAPTRLCLLSGGSFGSDSAAPGGQATFANVLALVGSWTMPASLHTHSLDFAPAGTHLQFMQDFAALTTQGTYSAP
ncbi:MAG: hypothetical protein IT464_05425 [Planctomycetes bacterium]|nr:hypothetical protein [Planctomycetota bacterium]